MRGAGDAAGSPISRRSPPHTRLPPLHTSALDSSDDSTRLAAREYRNLQAKRRRRAKAEAVQRQMGRLSVSESASTQRSARGPSDSVAGDSSARLPDTLTSPDRDAGDTTDRDPELSIASQLQQLADDVTTNETEPRRRSLSAERLPQPPLTRLYVEKGNRFQLSRRQAAGRADRAPRSGKKSHACAVDLAMRTQRVLAPLGRLCAGMFAGLAVGHCMFVIALTTAGGGSIGSGGTAGRGGSGQETAWGEYSAILDFVRHYSPLALPCKAVFYTLSVVCCVSVLDRYDVSRLTAGQLRRAFTLQDGTLTVVLYLAALVVTCCQAPADDRLHLFRRNGTISGVWGGVAEAAEDCDTLLVLCITRAVLATLAWAVLSVNPAMDRVLAYLSRLPSQSVVKPTTEPNTIA